MKFESVNVESDPEALQDLKRLHVLQMPAVTMGERVFRGWDPKALAAFVGVDYIQPASLSFQELNQRFAKILSAAVLAMRQVPEIHLLMPLPGRNRTIRDLGYHIFRLSLAYCEAMEQGSFQEEWVLQEMPSDIAHVSALADYGKKVQERLHRWQGKPGAWIAGIQTSGGYQTTHELLERTVWHAAQHLRQLYALLRQMGETPVDPLSDEDFRGLPLPKEVW